MEMLDCTSETYNQLKQSDLRDLQTHAHAYTHASTWEIMTPIYESNTAAPCSSQRMYITMDGSLRGLEVGGGEVRGGWCGSERHTHTHNSTQHTRSIQVDTMERVGLGWVKGAGGCSTNAQMISTNEHQ